ncbi:UNVERIFIED_ORG: tripartite ATP-independent transporter DctM subunit [Rhizobium esperanzae]|uniref:TRAP transporter large permease protein n=2 Tax=Rhizobium TaxID=379 RepID=A0A7W8XH46_9HYPH|nr:MULTISPECIES: TRAP transporter large permease subunit [Rhizobium]ACE94838.1 putative C4-dicarboxylate transport system, permease protein [Rhizobium etli CIAT 652]MDH6645797.1 tripartite ATP-independent transporter DctM subunit [Rhizobium esperanzae]MBB5552239.1 tripartite ATP-independent transporter DctM subunit [Rhizobium lentis]MBB5562777.1 tripartite ATP-independent transporter DctM subunit [Rhizobium lentis]MBB5570960.1 tripartite ATP-independent transporter DctM subunit [Rhizobium lent
MTLVMIISFCILMVLAVPVGYGLIIAAGLGVLFNGYVPLSVVAQQVYDQTQSFPMLALPFFMLAGTLMLGGELGRQLLELASRAMQRWRGGPLSTTVVSSVVFGGVSGSAVANASALGSVLIPWQKKHGFPPALCAANNATSAVIDVLIPPSIPMILYALISGVSVGDLFISGIVPGLIMAASFVFVCWYVSVRRGYAIEAVKVRKRELARLAVQSFPAILLPILIIVFLRSGLATPTEVSVLSVVYSLLLSILFYRDLTWKRFCENMVEAGVATGVVMLVIMGSAAVGWVLTFDQAPQHMAEWVSTHISSPIVIILMMNLIMLVVGMPLDMPPAILLLGPIFVPLADSIGLDRVQLGLMMVINLGIGLYTPPIGTTLFISSSIAKAPLGTTTNELWPFFGMAMLLLLAVSFVPALTIY